MRSFNKYVHLSDLNSTTVSSSSFSLAEDAFTFGSLTFFSFSFYFSLFRLMLCPLLHCDLTAAFWGVILAHQLQNSRKTATCNPFFMLQCCTSNFVLRMRPIESVGFPMSPSPSFLTLESKLHLHLHRGLLLISSSLNLPATGLSCK